VAMWKWLKKLRGALGNALVWAGIWSLGTLPVLGVLELLGFGHMFGMTGLLHVAPRIAASLAAMGFVAGGAFSTYLGLSPTKRLDELDLRVLGLLGGVCGVAMVPIFSWLTAVISALGAPFPVVFGIGAAVAGVLGGATAVGSVKIARRALGAGSGASPRLEANTVDPEKDWETAPGLLEPRHRS
jgi:hypothetical protein